jgi:mannitol-1-phosphate/altronate dehydrogenase
MVCKRQQQRNARIIAYSSNNERTKASFILSTNATYNAKLYAWYPTEIKDMNERETPEELYKVATEGLLPFNGLKERFEVSSTKAGEVVSLDDFNEDGGTIHQVLFSISVTD